MAIDVRRCASVEIYIERKALCSWHVYVCGSHIVTMRIAGLKKLTC